MKTSGKRVPQERGPQASVSLDGDQLRLKRKNRRLTQEKLADLATELSVATIQRAEAGIPVSWETALELSALLECPIEEILPSEPIVRGGMPRLNNHFTGRDDELDRIHAILMDGRAAAVTQVKDASVPSLGRAAMHGMGGVGKTMLAVRYVQRYGSHYDEVWWCQAEPPRELCRTLAKLATTIGIQVDGEADTPEAAREALDRLAELRRNYLLVYDNVTIPKDIEKLLPTAGARVLITSRFSDWESWADEVALDVLPLAKAISFLQARTGRQDEPGATILAETLGRLPLALDHAAAYCKRAGKPFVEYAVHAKELIDIAPTGTSKSEKSVHATFRMAIQEVTKYCPDAESLMDYLAWCSPQRIPIIMIEDAASDRLKHEAAIIALTEMSLIKHDPFEDGTPAVVVHRLVQMVARSLTEIKGKARAMTEAIMRRLLVVYPVDGYSDRKTTQVCVTLLPHLLVWRATKTADEAISPEAATLLARPISFILVQMRDSMGLRSRFTEFLSAIKQILESDDPKIPESIAAMIAPYLQSGIPGLPSNVRVWAAYLQMGRFPGSRAVFGTLECIADILEEICSETPNTGKIIRTSAYLIENKWQHIDPLISYGEKQIGLH